ncbi:MAG: hypothetical protein HGA80_05275 [Candidatus Omnitrophica bacterium]|nr:hypothetical protein [Candidatus Omnitrophota bacterium]
MRKVWVLLFYFFSVAGVASAAPAYGTKMPEQNKVFWGYQHYAVLDRDLNKDHGELQSQQDHILLSYGVMDWLSLDLKASRGTVRHEDGSGSVLKYDRPLWGGGYGFRVKLFKSGAVKSVAGFQHISIHPMTVKRNGEKNNAILDDWQGSWLVSYSFRRFTPYVGLRYGTADYIHRLNNDADRILTAEGRRLDLVSGLDIPLTSRTWLNVEGAVGGGVALATGVNCSF